MCKPIKLSNPFSVIDGTAWFAYALMALSLYVFRQPSYVLDQGPFSHRWENLPKIFIPNNLTGPEIGRALRTSSKAQILAENNKVGPFFQFNTSFITPELSHKNPCTEGFLCRFCDVGNNKSIVHQEFILEKRGIISSNECVSLHWCNR